MASFTWNGTDDDYHDAANWTGAGAPPPGAADSATFGTAGNTSVAVNPATSVASWLFPATGSQSYIISGQTVTLSTGIAVNATGVDIAIANDIAGAGAIEMAAAGSTLTLSGINTYSGETIISAGTLRAQGGSAISDSSLVTVDDGATLVLDASETIGWLEGRGTVAAGNATGTYVLTWGAEGGAFRGSLQDGGPGATLALTKVGLAEATLAGDSTYTGATTVNEGTLRVDGSITSAVTVNSGGTLHGHGTVGAVSVASGGTIGSGRSGTTLHMDSLTLVPGAIVALEIAGAGPGDVDQLGVAGALNLAGATLRITLPDGDVPTRSTGLHPTLVSLPIIRHNGITGTFDGLPEGAIFLIDGYTFEITYVGFSGDTVTLFPLNDAPRDIALAGAGIAENSQNGATVGALIVTDPDNTSDFTYELLDDADGRFALSGGNLIVADGTKLDREIGASHQVEVRVTDFDGLTFQKRLTVTVTNVNEAPTDVALSSASVAENSAAGTLVGSLSCSDPDMGDTATYTLIDDAGGRFAIDGSNLVVANGALLDFESSATHQVTVRATDAGGLPFDKVFTIGLTNVNDAPTDVTLSPSSVAENSANGTTVGTLFATDADDTSDFTYELLDDADGRFALSGGSLRVANGTLLDFEQNASHQVTVRVTDGGGLAFEKDVVVTITDARGAPSDDTFVAPVGPSQLEGGPGIDTVTFDFKLTDATITYAGSQVIVDGPSGHTVLMGFERFVFSDGTVDNNDGNWLVDDLFYYSQNHDVWSARVDADFHYNGTGWKEGRDPSAFFDLSLYLSANPDVKAAGVNPLTHYDTTGWKEGRVPSLAFDGRAYLDANADVKAAAIDPLWHFLVHGASEGRQPIAPTTLVGANGFDFVYYLANNPDVAAAGVDPYLHFQTTGWAEGRNPNAWFDTAGYLAAYGDVAAAQVNPLDHYNAWGWQEGRDPSLTFDTASYLSDNPDVAAAHINPLVHFLRVGHYEGRSAVADGVWG